MAKYQDKQSWTTQYEDDVTWVEAFVASDPLTPLITEVATLLADLTFSASDTLAPQVTETYLLDTGGATPVFSYLDPGTWANASQQYHDMESWGEASSIIAKVAADMLLVRVVETPITAAFITSDDAVTPGFGEIADIPISYSASDTLVPVLGEAYSLFQGGSVPFVASDTLLVAVVEAPITAVQIASDDAVTPSAGDVAVLDDGAIVAKSALDTLLVVLSEGYTLDQSGSQSLSGSDTLLVAINEAALLGGTNFLTASDTLVPVLTEAGSVAVPIVKSGSDVLSPLLTEVRAHVFAIEAPPAGTLPPGWYELEISELAGIARPWRIDPANVTPIQGWMPRKYWAIYDERGNLIATDRWKNVARGKAWTHYHTGRWAA